MRANVTVFGADVGREFWLKIVPRVIHGAENTGVPPKWVGDNRVLWLGRVRAFGSIVKVSGWGGAYGSGKPPRIWRTEWTPGDSAQERPA